MLTSADGPTDGLLLISVAAISTLLGVLIGTFFTKRKRENVVAVSKLPREDSFISLESQRHVSTSTANNGTKDYTEPTPIISARVESTDTEDSRRVLEGAVELFCKQWDVRKQNRSQDVPRNKTDTLQPQHSKVVEYLKPEEMLAKLFHAEDISSGGLEKSLSLKRRRKRSDLSGCDNSNAVSMAKSEDFLHLLNQIQRYSVNTSHPNFFNQLFGAMDPVALAAELLALSLNTSSYTYETAPVFTLLEREVMNRLGRLVFEGKDESEDDEDDDSKLSKQYDGLMVPGGSLSNLTALHIARHHWLVTNGYDSPIRARQDEVGDDVVQAEGETDDDEEKKDDCAISSCIPSDGAMPVAVDMDEHRIPPRMVAFVSDEAHYSFRKAMAVTGIGASNLIAVRTLRNGQMDPNALDTAIREAKERGFAPFFVAATSGSTVRGSFDDIDAIVRVCRQHETVDATTGRQNTIWVHVDGAWGGSVIFSRRPIVLKLLAGVQRADSFTFNPHKMLGAPNQTTAFITRHRGLLRASNSTGAKYLFDPRKNGAEYDLGDSTYTCGRRPDAIKLWALWKYHGRDGLGHRVDQKVDSLAALAQMIQKDDAFMLACETWPFNVNFFYLPPRIRLVLKERNISTDSRACCPALPDDISKDLAKVSVQLKLRLHEAGEMIIPFQPLNDQKADCFRLVLAGDKVLSREDFAQLLSTMDRYGRDL